MFAAPALCARVGKQAAVQNAALGRTMRASIPENFLPVPQIVTSQSLLSTPGVSATSNVFEIHS